VAEVARWTFEGLVRVCKRHGRSLDELDDAAEFAHDQPALAACYGASVSDRQLLGDTPGQRTRKLVHPVCEAPARMRLCWIPSTPSHGCSSECSRLT
jgi:hypothetical protein